MGWTDSRTFFLNGLATVLILPAFYNAFMPQALDICIRGSGIVGRTLALLLALRISVSPRRGVLAGFGVLGGVLGILGGAVLILTG